MDLTGNGFGTNLVRDMEKRFENGTMAYPGNWVSHQDISDLVEFFGDLTLYERYLDCVNVCQWIEPLPRQSPQQRKWYLLEDLLRWVDITESQIIRLNELKVMLHREEAVRLTSLAKVLARCQARGIIVEGKPRSEKWRTDYSSPLYCAPICELADSTIAMLDIPTWSIAHLCPHWGSLQCIQCEHPPIRNCSWECWSCLTKCSCWRCDRLCEVCSDKERCLF